MINLLGISGSLRASSSNSKIIRSLAVLPPEINYAVSEIIGMLPHFNPDIDKENSPEIVKTWRSQIKNADGVIICTPEYAFGVPGVLKNALDWIVSSGEFVSKPVAVISASPMETGGKFAHESILLTLQMLTASVIENGSLILPFINQKFDKEGNLIDEEVIRLLSILKASLIDKIIQTKENKI